MHELNNLLADIPPREAEETLQTILHRPGLHVERIISHGHASAEGFWFDQPQDEFVVLLQGAALLRFEDDVMEMQAGSFVYIPARLKHRVDWTDPAQPTVWLALHVDGITRSSTVAAE